LAFTVGVVALGLQGGPELDGSGAVAVAEHASVHLAAQLAHLGAFVVGGKPAALVVKSFDLLGDGEVFLGNGFVRDPRVDHSHGKGFVAWRAAMASRPQLLLLEPGLMPRLIAWVARMWRSW